MVRESVPQFVLNEKINIKNHKYYVHDYDQSHKKELLLEKKFFSKPTTALNLDLLKKVALWKSPRSAGHVSNNTNEYVQEITSFSLRTKEERARIEAITILSGVGWPMASVILHFFHKDPYPILDFRALRSFNVEQPNQYHFEFWMAYVEACRNLSKKFSVDMRTLDKVLWMYDKSTHKE